MLNKLKIPAFTEIFKRFLFWNVGIFLLILMLFNILTIAITNFVLEKNLDERIAHEIENIISTIELKNDSLVLISNRELEESDLREVRESSFFLQIFDAQGKVLMESDNLKLFGNIPFDVNSQIDNYLYHNINLVSANLRAGYHKFINSEGEVIGILRLSVFRSGGKVINDIILFNLLSLPVILLLIFIASTFLAKKMLTPINRIIQTAEKITLKHLNQRISYQASSTDEIGRLRDTLNNLFERLEQQVNQISQFTDYASHQLMNPLTIAKTEIEYILRKDRATEAYKNSFEKLQIQIERIAKIISDLLIISRCQNDRRESKSILNLSKFVEEEIAKLCAGRNITMKIEPDIYSRGDSEIFSLIIENLIDNAVKYSETGSEITISLKKNDKTIEMAVADLGIGISDEEKEKIFQKFYKSTKAEKLGIQGYGLGLSVVKSIIAQMNGNISIIDNKPCGSIFIVQIPAVELE